MTTIDQLPQSPAISFQDLCLIIGEKEIQLRVAQAQFAKATELITLQQDKIAALTASADETGQ